MSDSVDSKEMTLFFLTSKNVIILNNYISLDGKYNTYRKVDVTVNGKILVGKTNENSYTPATKYK